MAYNKKSLSNLSRKGRGRPKGSLNKIKTSDIKKLIKNKDRLLIKSKAIGLSTSGLVDNIIAENLKGVDSNINKPVNDDTSFSNKEKLIDQQQPKKFTWHDLFKSYDEIYIEE
jgi:hypothetical protein